MQLDHIVMQQSFQLLKPPIVTAIVELLTDVKSVSRHDMRRLKQVVVLLHANAVYLDNSIWPFVLVGPPVVQLVPICHQSGSTKTTDGPL